MTSPKKIDPKKLLWIFVPVVALFSFYLIFFNSSSTNTEISSLDSLTQNNGTNNASIPVELKDTNSAPKEINSKVDFYEDQMIHAQNEKSVKDRASNFDQVLESATTKRQDNDLKDLDEQKKLLSDVTSKEYLEKMKKEEVRLAEEKRNKGTVGTAVYGGGYVKKKKIQKETTIVVEPEKRDFYSSSNTNHSKTINNNIEENSSKSNFIEAVVQNDNVLRNGQKIVIRTLSECTIADRTVPHGFYLSGIVSLAGERVNVTISSFKLENEILSTKLIVFDADGNLGIYTPGGVNQEISKDAANNTTQQGGTLSQTKINVPVVGQVTTSGVTKKLNDQSVRIPKGYKVYLKEVKDRQY